MDGKRRRNMLRWFRVNRRLRRIWDRPLARGVIDPTTFNFEPEHKRIGRLGAEYDRLVRVLWPHEYDREPVS